MRLFIAINFDDKVKDRLLRCQGSLRQASAGGNFTCPENLHLILVFLGEIQPGRVREIQRVMDSTPNEPFPLQFEGMGKFGDTWWVGIRENLALTDLHNHLSQGLKSAGFPPRKPIIQAAHDLGPRGRPAARHIACEAGAFCSAGRSHAPDEVGAHQR